MQSRGLPYHLPLLDPAPRRFGNSSAVEAAHLSDEIDGFSCPETAAARQLGNRGNFMKDPTSDTVHLVERLRAGDRRALAELFHRHRDRLRKMVELRIDARLRGRVDASDVLQDAFLDLARRVKSYLSDPRLPVFLWLRLVVGGQLPPVHP